MSTPHQPHHRRVVGLHQAELHQAYKARARGRTAVMVVAAGVTLALLAALVAMLSAGDRP